MLEVERGMVEWRGGSCRCILEGGWVLHLLMEYAERA